MLAVSNIKNKVVPPKRNRRNRMIIFDQINLMRISLRLTDEIVYRTYNIYSNAKEEKITQGRDPSIILAAAAYIACKESGVVRTLAEFTSVLHLRRNQLARNYRLLMNKLALKYPSADPFTLLHALAARFKIREETEHQAEILVRYSKRMGFVAGKNPMSIAASALYFVTVTTPECHSQKSFAEAAGITEVTLRNRIKELKNIVCYGNKSEQFNIRR
jgi:transcription initiation factor TFIIB